MSQLQPVKGTKDILFDECELFLHVVDIAREVARTYGYREAYLPIFEYTEVFKRPLGETSDIVNKEMYTFKDKGGRDLTLRPEFTAGIARSVISNQLYNKFPLKVFTNGPVFRHENPQKGRYRQFNQINVENIGKKEAVIDAEIISIGYDILQKLKLENVSLEVNSLGDLDSRRKYIEALVKYLDKYKADLSKDSQVRLHKNPLRILDSKIVSDQKILEDAPALREYLTKESKDFFDDLLQHLDSLKIEYSINDKIVRGLDYYTDTVFEFVTKELGSQGTVIAGGRYDGLFKLLGGKDTPAVGFAGGIERLMSLCKDTIAVSKLVAIFVLEKQCLERGLEVARLLRKENVPTIVEEVQDVGKSIRKALNNNSSFVIFIGEEEINQKRLKLKNLETREEKLVDITQLIEELKQYEF